MEAKSFSLTEIRWATEDPNPGSKEEFQQLSEQMVYQALTKDLPSEYTIPANDEEEEVLEAPTKKARMEAPETSNPTAPIQDTAVSVPAENKAQNSLISFDVLQTLGYMSQHINNTKAYLNQSASAQPSEQKPVSLLGDDYDSE